MRTLALGILTGAALFAVAPTAAADAVTTRIETRPFYGATVTLEEGVRVFRPLPRHDRVIINPGGKTPVSLGYSESYNYSNHTYTGPAAPPAQYVGPTYNGGYGNLGSRGHHRHHGDRHGHGGGKR